jgi:hypothetical protein
LIHHTYRSIFNYSIQTMLVKPFESDIYENLRSFFDLQGYVLMPDKKQFRKVTDTGFHNVIFTTTAYENEVWLEVNLGCRNHQLEQIAQQFLGNTRDFWADSNSLVISIGKFNNAKYFRYKMASASDVLDVCEEVKDFLLTQGFEFLNNSDSLPVLHEIYNKTPTKPCKFLYNQVHRSFKGIITAKLIYSDNFLDLADTHRDNLMRIGASDEELITFERLLSYLLYMSVN